MARTSSPKVDSADGLSFAETLARFMAKRDLTPGVLGRLSGVPRATITNWLEGIVKKPQRWHAVVALAKVLQLTESETNLLLESAGHPSIRQLDQLPLAQGDRDQLVPWLAIAHYETIRAYQQVMDNRRTFPIPTTALIGRDEEVVALLDGLHNPLIRLMTLVGPPGVGKTRLALHVADAVRRTGYEVLLIPLASVRSSAQALPLFAQVIGIPDQGAEKLLDMLPALVKGRKMLCVFDNFEHVLDASVLVSDLLLVAPDMKILATSRAPLHVPGEHLFAVNVLATPSKQQTYDSATVIKIASVQLFIERARALQADFAVNSKTLPLVAAICSRLEGLPLAIELVVPRLKYLSLADIVVRLNERVVWLADDYETTINKSTSLRAAIEWSYQLLSAQEQRLFARMAVFVGGCPQKALLHVCTLPGDSLVLSIDTLRQVVDSNLVQQIHLANGKSYYAMLESIREYGLEKLSDYHEIDRVKRRHAEYYLLFAEEAGQALSNNDLDYLDRLEHRQANLRAALEWAMIVPEAGIALRFCAALWRFWIEHSHLTEGFAATQRALKLETSIHPDLQEHYAGALLGASELARTQGEIAYALDLAQMAFDRYQQLNLPAKMVQSLSAMILVQYEHEQYQDAQHLCEQSLLIASGLNDPRLYATSLNLAALIYAVQRDFEQANACYLESQALYVLIKDPYGLAQVLNDRGLMAIFQYAFTDATELLEHALILSRAVGGQWRLASTLSYLGFARLFCQDYQRAKSLSQECLALRRTQGDKTGIAYCFEALAGIAISEEDFQRAARLCGAAEALRATINSRMAVAVLPLYTMYRDILIQSLGQPGFQVCYDEGSMTRLDESIEYALQRGRSPTLRGS